MLVVTAGLLFLALLLAGKRIGNSILAMVNQALESLKGVHPYLYKEYATPLEIAVQGEAVSLAGLLLLFAALTLAFLFSQKGAGVFLEDWRACLPVLVCLPVLAALVSGLCGAILPLGEEEGTWLSQTSEGAWKVLNRLRYGGEDGGLPEGDFKREGQTGYGSHPSLCDGRLWYMETLPLLGGELPIA